MKARGIRGGVLLSPEPDESLEAVREALADHAPLLSGSVSLEVTARVPYEIVDAVAEASEAAGGRLTDLRPSNGGVQTRGESVILTRTIRSGARIESSGSVVVLGDVNAGAEILAADDIIVIGTLRGLAHAGAAGNENAVIWAQEIRSPQLRIGAALAQAGGDGQAASGPEVAHLREGQIVVRPWRD